MNPKFVLIGWQSKKLDGLREDWRRKRKEFEIFETLIERIQVIIRYLQRDRIIGKWNMLTFSAILKFLGIKV